MEFRQLKYFKEVFFAGSFLKASKTLHVAQSAISHQIAKLEYELGTTLFKRSNRGVIPTEDGNILIGYAQDILDKCEAAKRNLAGNNVSVQRLLRLGIPVILSHLLTAPLIEFNQSDDPPFELKIFENLSGYLHEWLMNDRLDLSILFNLEDFTGDAVPIGRWPLYLIGTQDSVLPRCETIPLSQLQEIPLVLTPQPHAIRRIIDDAVQRANSEIIVRSEIDSFSEVKSLVERGGGSTILPGFSVPHDWLKNGYSMRKIINPELMLEAALVSRCEDLMFGELNEIASMVKDIIANVAPELSESLT
jgi:LysR family transcriptional regulator, nitrogen assimilation regulatory protein